MNKINRTKLFLTLSAIVILIVTGFTGCKKNVDAAAFNVGALPDLTTQVKSSVSGFVIDENLLPVNLATVQVGITTVTTDKYGYFEVRNIDVIKNAAVVTVTKTGYFKGIKTYIAAAGKSAFFRIKLIPKKIAGTVNGNAGGIVTLTNGLSIILPANTVVNAATNTAYTGTVNVAAYWINPTSSNLSSIMPGDLRGLNTSGNLQLLTTYGMAAIELTGSGGEVLQIATGKKATINFPIPSSLSSSAPATIPLWYFDEVKGLWKEEGIATKIGSNYAGEVSHFSFWNCDVPGNFVQFNCTVKNPAGQPMQNVHVKITVVNWPVNNRGGSTDSAGYVSGPIPANAQLLLEVFGNTNCSFPSYSQTFSTTNANISLGTLTIPAGPSLATVSGTVTNCSNMPVTNGFLLIKRDSLYERHPLSNTGTYSFNLLLCGTSANVTLIGEDLTNSQQSSLVAYTLVSGNNNIPNIVACGINTQQFINYTINSTPYSYIYPADFMTCIFDNGIMPIIAAWRLPGANERLDMLLMGSPPSSITLQGFRVPQLIDSPFITPPRTVNITEYPSGVGQFLAGNFSLVFVGSPPNNTVYNVTCNFRLRRNQ